MDAGLYFALGERTTAGVSCTGQFGDGRPGRRPRPCASRTDRMAEQAAARQGTIQSLPGLIAGRSKSEGQSDGLLISYNDPLSNDWSLCLAAE